MKSTRSFGIAPYFRPVMAASAGVVGALLIADVAHAHPGHAAGTHDSMSAGLNHPWLGIDHVAAMVVVGVLAIVRGGRATWGLPLAFLGSMTAGSVIGFEVGAVVAMQALVAVSVVALGVGLIQWRTIRSGAAWSVVALAGLAHGWMHGASFAGDGSFASYLLGLTLATALLHAIGMTLGVAIARSVRSTTLVKAAGGLASACGVAALLL